MLVLWNYPSLLMEDRDLFFRVMQEAIDTLKSDPIAFTHHTTHGPILLQATASREGNWIARIFGRQLNWASPFRSLQEANEHLLCSFAELMPEHRCNGRCAPTNGTSYSGLAFDG